MNVLMYPIAPEDDFPDEFCAIRQGSGEHWFYTPAGEDASWMLFRAESENAKLRELVKALLTCATDGDCDECRLNGATPWHVGKAQLCDGVWDRMRELGVEVDG